LAADKGRTIWRTQGEKTVYNRDTIEREDREEHNEDNREDTRRT